MLRLPDGQIVRYIGKLPKNGLKLGWIRHPKFTYRRSLAIMLFREGRILALHTMRPAIAIIWAGTMLRTARRAAFETRTGPADDRCLQPAPLHPNYQPFSEKLHKTESKGGEWADGLPGMKAEDYLDPRLMDPGSETVDPSTPK